ncbi:MAG: LolA-related protein [Burkholderiaceae bacterium]|jgi:hypothetical protein
MFSYAFSAQDAGFTVDTLMQSLSTVKSARAHFVERKFLNVLKEPLESSGTLVYAAPSHLEKITTQPKPESLVVDQDQLTYERNEGREKRTLSLQEYPEIWAFIESIRATLAGDTATLNRFYELTLEGDATRWRLMLVPREQKMHALVESVAIAGSGNLIDTIEVKEADGDHSLMSVQKDP